MKCKLAVYGGFTLLEMIAAMVVIGLMAALLLPLLGTGLRSELDQDIRLQRVEDLRGQMDAWLREHRDPAGANNGSDLVAFREFVAETDLADGVNLRSLRWVQFDGSGQMVAGTETDLLQVTIGNEEAQLNHFFAPYHPPGAAP